MNKQLKRSDLVSLATGLERPSRDEAEAAVRTLIRWAGDNPEREGLVGTPDRVVRAYEEFFAGYDDDPREMLRRTFEERSEERRVGKSVDLGGRRIIKKKKRITRTVIATRRTTPV